MEKQLNFNKEKCPCGFDCSNSHIKHKTGYSSSGMILYWIGISAILVRVNFICEKCGEIIESTSEPDELRKFLGR